MRNLIVLAVLVAACSKGKVDQAISDLSELRDQMCKCTDKACADKIQTEFREIGKKYKDSEEDFKNASKDKQDEFDKIESAYRDCRKKARSSGKGGGTQAMAMTTEFRDRMCACADRACADSVDTNYQKWVKEHLTATVEGPEAEPPSAEDTKKMTEATTAYFDCMTKASKPKSPE
jgi:hypothetical protein